MTRNVWSPPSAEKEIGRLGGRTDQVERRADVPIDSILPGGPLDIYDAPRMEVGVFDSHADADLDANPNFGVTMWPGGVVAQMLVPDNEDVFLGSAASIVSDHPHMLLPLSQTALVTQQAASQAAAAVALEFPVERAQLLRPVLFNPWEPDDDISTRYRILIGLKLTGTPRNVSYALGRNGVYGTTRTISSASVRWGLTHWGLLESTYFGDAYPDNANGSTAFLPGDVFQFKIWADGAGAEMRLSHIYWVPESGSELGATDTTGHFVQGVGIYGDFASATAAVNQTDDSDSDTAYNRDTQYVSGLFDPAYAVSFGGEGNSIGLSGFAADGLYRSDFDVARMWEPRHFYQEARLAMTEYDSPNTAFATLYRDSFPHEQVPITSRDWGLVYWGPWHHVYNNLHWGLWFPRDMDNGGTRLDDYSLDDAARGSIRLGQMLFPRDFLSRRPLYPDWP